MATASHRHSYYAPAPHKTLPITMPSKAPAGYYPSRVAMSPPEMSDASTYSGSRSGASYSARSSTYAGSASGDYDRDSAPSYSGVDVFDTLSERMNRAFDPITMDKGLARQAQTSGKLNAKQRELLELQRAAQARMKSSRSKYAEGIKAAKESKRDLDWLHSEVSSMKAKTKQTHPEAYARASRKYSSYDY